MALGHYNKIQQFLLTQFCSILSAIIFISVQYSQGYNVKHFLMCSPILLLLIILYYIFFWRSQKQLFRCFCLTNLILLLCSSVCFFAVYYGVFNKTLAYTQEKVSDCQIIGNSEQYSILYVNFIKNGHRMLGYGCKSNNNEGSLLSKINPSDFYFYNSKLPCFRTSDRFLNQNNRILKSQSNNKTTNQKQNIQNVRSRNLQSSSNCIDYYQFSEVKLPSWMCMSSDTPFEDMISMKNCYISNYQNNSFGVKDKSIQNAIDRKALRKISSFMIVQFDDMPVPVKYLIPLIIFTFYPFIISTNVITLFIAQLIIKMYTKQEESKDLQFEQQQILQRQDSEKIEKQISKQYSIESPSTVPSKQGPEDSENIYQSDQLRQIQISSKLNGKQMTLSEDEIKQMKMKFQQQYLQKKQEEEKENNKENSLKNYSSITNSFDQNKISNQLEENIQFNANKNQKYIQQVESSPQKKNDLSNMDQTQQTKIEHSHYSNFNNHSKLQFRSIEKTPQRHQGKASIISQQYEQQQFVDENFKTNICVSENSPQHHSPIQNQLQYVENEVDDVKI